MSFLKTLVKPAPRKFTQQSAPIIRNSLKILQLQQLGMVPLTPFQKQENSVKNYQQKQGLIPLSIVACNNEILALLLLF